jgi:putative tricarboxylic transport membrane protein
LGSKRKLDFDALVGIVVTLFGLVYILAAYLVPRATIGKPLGPSKFPFLLGGILVALGILLFLKSDMSNTKEALNQLKKMSEKEKSNSKLIALTCMFCVIYALIFDKIGFVISTFFFLQGMLYLTNKKQIIKNSIVSICFSIGIYILFSKFLGIILPTIPFLNI